MKQTQNKQIAIRRSLTIRFIVIVGGLILFVQLAFNLSQTYTTSEQQAEDLYTKVLAQARFLGAVSDDNILSNDFYSLETLMQETSRDPDILYSIIVQNDGRALTNYLDTDNPLIQDAIEQAGNVDVLDVAAVLATYDDIVEIREPIVAEQLLVGEVHVGYSISRLRSRLNAALERTVVQSLLIALLLSGGTIFLFDRQIRWPLKSLEKVAAEFARGDLAKRVVVTSSDEIGLLHHSFNQMADQLQATLVDLRQLSRVASDTKNLVIITDVNGYIEWANGAFERITEYTLEECIGKRPGDILQGPRTDIQTIAYMHNQLVKREGFSVDVINYSKSGNEYWVSIEVEPIYDDNGKLVNFIAIETDITEKRATERAIRASEVRKSAVLEASLDGVVTIDSLGKIIEFNRAAEAIFGYPTDYALNQSISDLLVLPSAFRGENETWLARFLRTGESRVLGQRIETSGVHADGHQIPLEIAIVPVYLEDDILFTAFMRDITSRKKAENSLRKYAHELERSNRELQDFAYVASHDLQEPLRKIQAFGSRLSQRYTNQLDERGQMYVSSMENAANRMQALINDLLDFSRVSTKARPFVETDLNVVLQGVLSDLEVRISETKAQINFPDDLPVIDSDPLQMRQILQNLIGNGLKFAKPNVPPVIDIFVYDIDAIPGNEEIPDIPVDGICLEIQDNGIGFDNKYEQKIFQIFQRLHGRQEYSGTGVGLAICRKIAERHGGTIRALGELGVGAAFRVYLPRRQSANILEEANSKEV